MEDCRKTFNEPNNSTNEFIFPCLILFTVLGQLLFLAYLNDMPETTTSSQTKLFAKESLSCISQNQQPGIQWHNTVQKDLTSLEKGESKWQSSFNPSKCTIIRISPNKKKQLIPTSHQLHGHTLETEDACKYLRVTITNNLSWDRHINNIHVVGKGNKTLQFIRMNLKDCTKTVKAAAYTFMVRPTVEYASTVWDPVNKKKHQITGAGTETSSMIWM